MLRLVTVWVPQGCEEFGLYYSCCRGDHAILAEVRLNERCLGMSDGPLHSTFTDKAVIGFQQKFETKDTTPGDLLFQTLLNICSC